MSNARTMLDYVSLDAAVTALGTTATTLTISTVLSVIANTTVPRTLTLEFTGSGSLAVPTGVTVTINGPIQAPLKKIFLLTGTGTVTISVATEVYPEWWGAVADGVTDSTAALQAAINSNYARKVRLSSGQYLHSTVLTIPSNVYIEGNDPTGGLTTVLRPNNCAAFVIDGVHHSTIEHLSIWPTGSTPPATYITIGNSYSMVLRNIRIHLDTVNEPTEAAILQQNSGGGCGVFYDKVIVRSDGDYFPIALKFGADCGYAALTDCDIETSSIGIEHLGGRISITNLYMERMGQWGIHLNPNSDSGASFAMLGGDITTDNAGSGVAVDAGAKNSHIRGTKIHRPNGQFQGYIYSLTNVSNVIIDPANYDPKQWGTAVAGMDPSKITFPKLWRSAPTTLTYSASMTPDITLGQIFVITANNGTAFTINAPTLTLVDGTAMGPQIGQEMTIVIRNTSGGALGVATWNAVFKRAAWTQPANGNSRSIRFYYNGTNWVELSRTAVDVPN